jgi:hypothetical protein
MVAAATVTAQEHLPRGAHRLANHRSPGQVARSLNLFLFRNGLTEGQVSKITDVQVSNRGGSGSRAIRLRGACGGWGRITAAGLQVFMTDVAHLAEYLHMSQSQMPYQTCTVIYNSWSA